MSIGGLRGGARRPIFKYQTSSNNIVWYNNFKYKLVLFLGCTSTDSKEILEFLQSVPAEEIVKHLALLSYPVKDDARCPEPLEAYQTGTFNPVDLMVNFSLYFWCWKSHFFFHCSSDVFLTWFGYAASILRNSDIGRDVFRFFSNIHTFRLASPRMKVQTLYLIWLEDNM